MSRPEREAVHALARRVQHYLRASAAERYDAVPTPPFTCYFHPNSDFSHFNYAIPDGCTAGPDPRYPAGIAALRAAFAARGRRPRLEYVEVCAPGLATALELAGFECEARQALMVCRRDQLTPPPLPGGATIQPLLPDAPDETVAAYWRVQAIGFGLADPPPPPPNELEYLRATLATSLAFWAWMDGRPVAVGMITPPVAGVAELAAVATLPGYRRRGLAKALSATAVQAAFEAGVSLVCLTAADEVAEQVYRSIGFEPIGASLVYHLPSR